MSAIAISSMCWLCINYTVIFVFVRQPPNRCQYCNYVLLKCQIIYPTINTFITSSHTLNIYVLLHPRFNPYLPFASIPNHCPSHLSSSLIIISLIILWLVGVPNKTGKYFFNILFILRYLLGLLPLFRRG